MNAGTIAHLRPFPVIPRKSTKETIMPHEVLLAAPLIFVLVAASWPVAAPVRLHNPRQR